MSEVVQRGSGIAGGALDARPLQIRLRVIAIQGDRQVQIGAGCLEVAAGLVDARPCQVHRRRARVQVHHLLQVLERAFVLLGLEPNVGAAQVALAILGGQRDHLAEHVEEQRMHGASLP